VNMPFLSDPMKGKAMITIYSEDRITVTQRFREPPKNHWIQDGPNEGRFVPANKLTGYFPLIEVERPSLDHSRSVVRFGDTFTEVWTFDQELADQRIKYEAEQAEQARIKNIAAELPTYLEGADPTPAQMRRQIERLTVIVIELTSNQMGGF
jgi:hypothetical protein